MKLTRSEKALQFLSERADIYKRYARDLCAVFDVHLHQWKIVDSSSGSPVLVDLDFKDPRSLCLLLNHAYWLGASDMRKIFVW